MNAYLIINTRVFPLPGTPITVGRSLSNHLVISTSTVSRKHAQILHEDDHFVIIDLDSTWGTFVNGERVTKARLNSGDSILLADTPIVFVDNAPHLAERAEDPTGNVSKKKSTGRPTPVEMKPD